uniref:NADH-ubiquinone oxidoreductase chain 6 n=1 Tax=Rhizophydium sp. 136 TaxID=60187 RepID=Q950L8_9FUNG|nr:NADH dehydrogenase subunit 6 [Rhizophydium sp. 136]AAK84290.1 NADH dehydrogenase subunit 6 [Rhizophydium sp. 136]
MLIKILVKLICTIGILSSFLILTSLNPVTRLVLLIIVFIMSAFIYLLLDFYFLGLTYIIVYVGAIAILFLFVIMMSEVKETPQPNPHQLQIKINSQRSNVVNTSLGIELNQINKINFIPSGILRLNQINTNNLNFESFNNSFKSYDSKLSTSFGYPNGINLIFFSFMGLGLSLILILGYFTTNINSEGILGINSYFSKPLVNYPMYISMYLDIYNYFFINYSSEFVYFTDLQSFGFILYLVYPFITILLAILLWIVLIGILKISTNNTK